MEWKIVWVVTYATTLAETIGVKARTEKSKRITSSVKRTPPIGELKIALIPAAVPQPIKIGNCDGLTWKRLPMPDEIAAPI